MWFNILPPFIIVTAAVGLPGVALYWAHYLVVGNHYRRSLDERWERHLYLRDARITGSPYIMKGLDTLPSYTDKQLERMADEREKAREERAYQLNLAKEKKLQDQIIRLFSEDEDDELPK